MTDENTIPANAGTTGPGKVFNPSEEVGLILPQPSVRTAPMAVSSSAPASNAPGSTHTLKKIPDLRDDIAKILQQVKMPERRGEFTPAQHVPEDRMAPPKELPKTPTPTEQNELHSVHTFKDDLTRVAREQKISVIKAVSLEEEKRHQEKPRDFDRAVQKKPVVPIVLGVVVLASVAIIAAFWFSSLSSSTATTTQEFHSLLFAEQNTSFPLNQESGLDLKRSLATLRTKNLPLGSITKLTPMILGEAPRLATTAEFFTSLQTRAPDSFVRALGNDFFLGIHSVDTNAPVLVLSVQSYENAFAGMLAWESSVNEDLGPFFTTAPLFTSGNGTPARRAYTDEVIQNYDIRALKNDSGIIVFYYVFPSRNILILAESPYSFTEIITRLKAQRAL